MHGSAYGRVRSGGSSASSAPRLAIGFALVMAVAAFLSWSTSPSSPPSHKAKRLASSSGLVNGAIGQAENMGHLLGAASADAVANAKAAALQDPSANAGAGKGINEGAADITDAVALSQSSSAHGADPLPSESAAASAVVAAGIRGSSTSDAAKPGDTADAASAAQAVESTSASGAGSKQQDAAERMESDTASLQAVEQPAKFGAKKDATAANLTDGRAAAVGGSKAVDGIAEGSTSITAEAGSAGVTYSSASASKADDAADSDYADGADSTEDGDALDSVTDEKLDGSRAAIKLPLEGAAAAKQGADSTAGSKAGSAGAGVDMTAGSSNAGMAAGQAGSKTSPENELALQNVAGSAASSAAEGVDASGQVGGSRQLPEGSSATTA